jgi:hypothetical protein
MILDNFIVVRVIGLVDGAEHNAAFLSVSVLTTAPFARQLDRAASVAGTLPTRCTLTTPWQKLAESASVPTNPAA